MSVQVGRPLLARVQRPPGGATAMVSIEMEFLRDQSGGHTHVDLWTCRPISGIIYNQKMEQSSLLIFYFTILQVCVRQAIGWWPKPPT